VKVEFEFDWEFETQKTRNSVPEFLSSKFILSTISAPFCGQIPFARAETPFVRAEFELEDQAMATKERKEYRLSRFFFASLAPLRLCVNAVTKLWNLTPRRQDAKRGKTTSKNSHFGSFKTPRNRSGINRASTSEYK